MDFQIDLIAHKKWFLLQINTIKKFLLFRLEYIIDENCLFGYWHKTTLLSQYIIEDFH